MTCKGRQGNDLRGKVGKDIPSPLPSSALDVSGSDSL